MRLVTPLLLVGVCSTPCSAQIPQAVAKLANVKNLGIGSAFTGFLTALKAVHEEIESREEERQGVKESLRAKAHETAKFVVLLQPVREPNVDGVEARPLKAPRQ